MGANSYERRLRVPRLNSLSSPVGTWGRIPTVFLSLVALVVAFGIACGGEGTTAQDDETTATGEAENSPGLSLENLRSVPNAPYRWLVMLDVGAVVAGDLPEEVARVIGYYKPPAELDEKLGIEGRGDDLNLLTELGLSADEVDEATVLTVDNDYGTNFALALQGDFDFGKISDSLSGDNWFTEREFEGGRLLHARETGSSGVLYGGIALLENDGYVLLGNPWVLDDILGSLEPDASGKLDPQGAWPGEIGIATNALQVAAPISYDPTLPVPDYRLAALQGEYDFNRIRKEFFDNGLIMDPESVSGYEVWDTPSYDASIVLLDSHGYVILGEDYSIEFILPELLDLTEISPGYEAVELLHLQQELGILVREIDAVLAFKGESNEVDFDLGMILQGRFSAESIRESMDEEARIEGDEVEIEAWEIEPVFGHQAMGISGEDVFLIEYDDEVEEFLRPLETGSTLFDDPDNSLVRAMDEAGMGWFVGAWGKRYCEKDYGDLKFAEPCLAIALAASNGDDNFVDVRIVYLFDSAEAAKASEGLMRIDELETYREEGELSNDEIKIDAKDEFVIMAFSMTAERAARILGELIDHPY